MPESKKTRRMRWMFRFFPAYWGTGGRLTYIADDFKEVRVRIKLFWRTRNLVGTIYGGSLYSAVDPFYMLMLIQILGDDFIVWDKAANIKFKRPGTETLYAKFVVTDDQLKEIKELVDEKGEIDYFFQFALKDKDGKECAVVDKTIYIATKEFYKEKQKRKKQKAK